MRLISFLAILAILLVQRPSAPSAQANANPVTSSSDLNHNYEVKEDPHQITDPQQVSDPCQDVDYLEASSTTQLGERIPGDPPVEETYFDQEVEVLREFVNGGGTVTTSASVSSQAGSSSSSVSGQASFILDGSTARGTLESSTNWNVSISEHENYITGDNTARGLFQFGVVPQVDGVLRINYESTLTSQGVEGDYFTLDLPTYAYVTPHFASGNIPINGPGQIEVPLIAGESILISMYPAAQSGPICLARGVEVPIRNLNGNFRVSHRLHASLKSNRFAR